MCLLNTGASFTVLILYRFRLPTQSVWSESTGLSPGPPAWLLSDISGDVAVSGLERLGQHDYYIQHRGSLGTGETPCNVFVKY